MGRRCPRTRTNADCAEQTSSRRKGQDRIEAVESLNGRLLVHAEHHGVRWRIDIESDHISSLAFEVRIIRGHIAGDSVRLEIRSFPRPRNQHVIRELHRPAQSSRTPMSRPVGGLFRRAGKDSCFRGWRQNDRFASRVACIQARLLLVRQGSTSARVPSTEPHFRTPLALNRESVPANPPR